MDLEWPMVPAAETLFYQKFISTCCKQATVEQFRYGKSTKTPTKKSASNTISRYTLL
jgi:hypothetical protein